MNSLLQHWKIDESVLKKINIINLPNPEKIFSLGKINSTNIFIDQISKVETDSNVTISIQDKKYSLININNDTLELNNVDNIINAILDEVYYPKKRPSFGYFPFPYTKVPVKIRLTLFKILLKFKHDPKWPEWPIETSVDYLRSLFLNELTKAYKKPVKYIDFWPEKDFALLLTHDCDSETSYEWINYIRELEKAEGFTSSWNFVPKKYPFNKDIMNSLKQQGCEIGIHDYDHTANLPYRTKEEITQALDESLTILKEFEPKGFRSAQLQRTPEFLSLLSEKMLYDSSIPDTDIYSPVYFRNGACTVFPFFINKMVELPLTMQQDFRLKRMGMNPEQIFEAWKLKLDYIKKNHGLATLNIHPDDFIFGNKHYLQAYEKFLKYAKSLDPWNANPSDIANWWIERSQCTLKDGKIKGSKKARITEYTENI